MVILDLRYRAKRQARLASAGQPSKAANLGTTPKYYQTENGTLDDFAVPQTTYFTFGARPATAKLHQRPAPTPTPGATTSYCR